MDKFGMINPDSVRQELPGVGIWSDDSIKAFFEDGTMFLEQDMKDMATALFPADMLLNVFKSNPEENIYMQIPEVDSKHGKVITDENGKTKQMERLVVKMGQSKTFLDHNEEFNPFQDINFEHHLTQLYCGLFDEKDHQHVKNAIYHTYLDKNLGQKIYHLVIYHRNYTSQRSGRAFHLKHSMVCACTFVVGPESCCVLWLGINHGKFDCTLDFHVHGEAIDEGKKGQIFYTHTRFATLLLCAVQKIAFILTNKHQVCLQAYVHEVHGAAFFTHVYFSRRHRTPILL